MAQTLQREVFEYLVDFMSFQNTNSNPDYSDERIADYAMDKNLPQTDDEWIWLLDSLISMYGENMTPELKRALENAKVESPSFFTDIFHEAFNDAASVVANELSCPGY